MDTARCRAFLAAAESGTITKAAEQLGYTTSGVSQLINALEKDLGAKLLLREPRGVKLSKEGKQFYPVIKQLVKQEEMMYQLAADIQGLSVGTVTIAAYPSISAHWLPKVIRRFQEAFPQIRIDLREGFRKEVSQWLSDKTADVAFMSYMEPMPFEWIPLAEDPMRAVLSRSHPMAGEKCYPLNRIKEEKFIMPAFVYDDDVKRLFQKNGLEPRIEITTLESPSALAMIEENLGMSITNQLVLEGMNYDVVKIPLDPPQHLDLGIAIQSLEDASPAVKKFVDFAVRTLTTEEETRSK